MRSAAEAWCRGSGSAWGSLVSIGLDIWGFGKDQVIQASQGEGAGSSDNDKAGTSVGPQVPLSLGCPTMTAVAVAFDHDCLPRTTASHTGDIPNLRESKIRRFRPSCIVS